MILPNGASESVNVKDCVSISIDQIAADAGRIAVRIAALAGQLLNLSLSIAGKIYTETLQFSTTRLNYGGLRLWMHCPLCSSRCGKLYLSPFSDRFCCRTCGNLTYREHRVNRQAAINRERRLQRAISARTQGEGDRAYLKRKRPSYTCLDSVAV